MARISVVIPTFRRPDGLRCAVQSVLAQEGAPDFEVIVVDNAPEGLSLIHISEPTRPY